MASGSQCENAGSRLQRAARAAASGAAGSATLTQADPVGTCSALNCPSAMGRHRRPTYQVALQRVKEGPMNPANKPPDDLVVTFPDGAKRSVRRGITGKALAESISKSLAKKAVAMVIDG